MTQTVFLAGATGRLGRRIARHPLDRPDARLRLPVRGGDAGKRVALDPLPARGAEIIEGDLADRASLGRATRGVDVIVSAVRGGPEVIVAGQVAPAETGRRNGVRRILPSDHALDLFEATPGEHPMFDLRRAATRPSRPPASSTSMSSRARSWRCSAPAWARSATRPGP